MIKKSINNIDTPNEKTLPSSLVMKSDNLDPQKIEKIDLIAA
jgi:hypothetical protein